MSVALGVNEAAPPAAVAGRARVAGFVQLTKPRITVLVVLTTLVGFLVAAPRPLPVLILLHTLVGTAMAAGAAGALNQWAERRADAEMRRTARRPLPSGTLAPREALVFGLLLTVAGTAYLALTANALASALAVLQAPDKLLLSYYYVQGLTLKQIGRLTAEHEATISRHLERLRGKLRKMRRSGRLSLPFLKVWNTNPSGMSFALCRENLRLIKALS